MKEQWLFLLSILGPISFLILIGLFKLKKTVKPQEVMLIVGVNGKMGQMVYQLFARLFTIIGFDIKHEPTPVLSFDDLWHQKIDIIVDFSHSSISEIIIKEALQRHIPVVSGTTGFKKDMIDEFVEMAKKNKTSLVVCSNYAKGIASIMRFLQNKPFAYQQVSMNETHHVSKKDMPSGTSKMLAELLKMDEDMIKSSRTTRHQHLHRIILKNNDEEMQIWHQVTNKDAYSVLINEYVKKALKKYCIIINHQRVV